MSYCTLPKQLSMCSEASHVGSTSLGLQSSQREENDTVPAGATWRWPEQERSASQLDGRAVFRSDLATHCPARRDFQEAASRGRMRSNVDSQSAVADLQCAGLILISSGLTAFTVLPAARFTSQRHHDVADTVCI